MSRATSKSRGSRRSQGWEVRLGSGAVIFLLGFIAISMILAYGIGIQAGHKVGYEDAQQIISTQLTPLPVPDSLRERAPDDTLSAAYDELEKQDEFNRSKLALLEDSPLPEIENIKKPRRPSILEVLPQDVVKDTMGKVKAAESKDRLLAIISDDENEVVVTNDGSGNVMVNEKLDGKTISKKLQATKKEIIEVKEEPIENKVVKKVVPKQPEVEKKIEVAKSEVTSPFIKDLSVGWYAQVAAPTRIQDANRLAQKLQSSGFPTMIEKADVKGRTYYRVLSGPEQQRSYAQRLADQIKREKFVANAPFLKLVK